MNEITKAEFTVSGNSISLHMPISKVDYERRLVSGFATLDNVDKEGDVILASASLKAFQRFRGNLREMHTPIAAGRVVDFKEDKFYDEETGDVYNGIYVTAYISKGAENTWEKVKDGTLSGFSVGGNIIEKSTEFVHKIGRMARFIKDYDLIELSLVDNPANQYANIVNVVKSADGVKMDYMVDEDIDLDNIKNVFWCEHDKIAKAGGESSDCSLCDKQMKNIGWFENEDEAEGLKGVVEKFLDKHSEGGVEMGKENETDAVEVESTEDEATVDDGSKAVIEDAVDATGADAPETEEVASDETDIEKALSDLRSAVNESIESTKATTNEAVTKLETRVEDLAKTLDTKTAEFEKSLTTLSDTLTELRSESDEIGKRLKAVEGETAISKSHDVEPDDDSEDDGLWKGAFFGVGDL